MGRVLCLVWDAECEDGVISSQNQRALRIFIKTISIITRAEQIRSPPIVNNLSMRRARQPILYLEGNKAVLGAKSRYRAATVSHWSTGFGCLVVGQNPARRIL